MAAGQMTFFDHLEELRRRIFYAAIAVALAAIAGYFLSDRVLELLTRPVPQLVFLAPAEAFVVKLKVALVTGLFIAAPVVIYQFWRFVRPALAGREAKYIALAVLFCTVFFFGGMAFAYFVVVPLGIRFLLSFQTPRLTAMISINEYVGTVAAFIFACGLIFQLPMVLFFLTKLGVVTPKLLWKNQRIAVVIIFIAAAIFSPPDVFSQCLMAAPMLVLYELGILASYIAARSGRRRALADDQ
jgi:sec-independent protein translocase protein TatC